VRCGLRLIKGRSTAAAGARPVFGNISIQAIAGFQQ